MTPQRVSWATSLLFVLLTINVPAQEPTPKQIAQATFPSTVLIATQDSAGRPLLLGSGFFVEEHIIVTNYHVIRGAASGYARLIGQQVGFPIDKVVGIDRDRDLALLSVTAKAPPLPLFESGPEVGDTVYAVGNPEGLEGTFSQGLVSGIRHRGSDSLLQITAPISSGSSGGPILNSIGQVVGIAVSTSTAGQNLNFAVPVAYLSLLLKNRKPPTELGQLDPQAPVPLPEPSPRETPGNIDHRPSGDPLITRAHDVAWDFVDNLPDFICDQVTRRYKSHKIQTNWKCKDRLEVELFLSSGKKAYRNVRHNGKPLEKGSPEDMVQWPAGEFGSVLADLFSPSSRAKFKYRSTSTAAGIEAKVYEYSVLKADSHWEIRMGYSVKPSYSGALWIDPANGRVLRIERGTKSLPAGYPVDKVESVFDYDWVSIGGTKYLMPAKSENLSCQVGTFECDKTEIDFRNYRKFNGE